MTTDLAATIKSAVTMPDVARMYGYEPNFANFIPCPFHSERTASMKLYPGDGGFHCFGCHAGGSVIDFVMKLFNQPFRAACARLNADFRLGIDLSAPVDTDALRRRRAAQEAQKRAQEKRDAIYRAKTDEYRRLYRARMDENPASWDDMSAEFLEGLRRLDWLEWWFEENSFGR
jgi:DNA primase